MRGPLARAMPLGDAASVAALLLAVGWAGAENLVDPAVLGFEAPGAWQTAPPLTQEFAEADLWSSRTIPFNDLAGGATLSTDHVKQGLYSLRWADHPRYATVHATTSMSLGDCQGVGFWAWSEFATGEKVTLALQADNPQTAWRDYFIFTLAVDWTGWQEVQIPLEQFARLGEPSGWQQVQGLYFFTKALNHQPNPWTVLYLDDLKAVTAPIRPYRAPADQPAPEGRLPHSGESPAFDPAVLNHNWPEVRVAADAPYQYQPYFLHERALYGYYPRFEPGFVSFDPHGKPYLQCNGTIIETLGPDGKWQYRDLLEEVIEPFAREKLGFKSLEVWDSGQPNETAIRFDNDGDAYMMCALAETANDWRSRRALLLYSPDEMKTWQVYVLPSYLARFEKYIGHNADCLRRPPVILLTEYLSPTKISFALPEKQPDGTLLIPPPIRVSDAAIAWLPHSGEANNVVTLGDTLFLAYGTLEVLPGKKDEDGAPAYAVAYDLHTKQLSKPVLIGFGGKSAGDDHNWPAIAADSKGLLHVLINGHHAPFQYVRSLRSRDISEWTAPEASALGTSYGGLVCDRDDTLYTVTRNAEPGYYFRLSLHRRKAGQPWEEPRHLAIPFKPYYKIWMHKLTLDPVRERLFLTYWSQSQTECLFRDEYLAALFIWPDREIPWLTESDTKAPPLGTYIQEPRKYAFYTAPPTELCLLLSEDHGDTWRLATTEDFQQ